jgi:hypothetical protein
VLFGLLVSLLSSTLGRTDVSAAGPYVGHFGATFSIPSGQANPTNNATIHFKVSFGMPIDDPSFDASDITVTNGTLLYGGPSEVYAAQDYEGWVQATSAGPVTVSIAYERVERTIGANKYANDASNTFSVTYTLAPHISSIVPNSGSQDGGTSVVINGLNFTGANVTFDGTAATCTVDSDIKLTCTTPAHDPGAVDVVVTNSNGSKTSTGGFTYLSNAKTITAFSFASPAATGSINGTAISVKLPVGTNVTALVATFTTTGASVKVGSTTQTSGVTANNFTNPVVYRVTAADGSTQDYTVTITPPSSDKELTDLGFYVYDLDEDVWGVFTGTNIAVTLPYRDVTALVADFSTTGVSVTVGTTVQDSGSTENDFTNPVVYTVYAEDASTQNYTVTVTLGPSINEITDFDFIISGRRYSADISDPDVKVLVPQGTDLTTLVANFSLSEGVSVKVGSVVQVSGTTPNDFTNPLIYTVVGGDGTTHNYTVTVDFQSWATLTTANGLGGNRVRDVFVNGSNLYAATNNGLSISTDGGITFTNKTIANGLGNNDLTSVFVDGANVYAGSNSGLSISTDGGITFTTKTTANGLGDNLVLGVFAQGVNVYAATSGGLSISTDGGITFTNKTTTNGLGNNFIFGVYASGSNVYAATNGGLSISTDGGATFTNKTTANGLGANSVMSVVASGSKVYAATTNGLSISTDGGVTFTNKTFMDGLPTNNLNDIQVNGLYLYIATMSGVSISADGGLTYKNYDYGDGVGRMPRNVAATATTLYAATDDGISYMPLNEFTISPSSGATFTDANNGITITFPAGAVSSLTTITYTSQTPPASPTTGFKFAGKSFTLVGSNASGPVTQFALPYTITIAYQDSDWQNAGITNENTLNLYYYNTTLSQWVGILPCAGCSLDTVNNRLTIVLDHFTEFALMAKSSYVIYLPLIKR